jgi:hypothetical protein
LATQKEIRAKIETLAKLRQLNGLPKDYSSLYRSVYKELGVLDSYIKVREQGYRGSFLRASFPA